MPSTIFPISHSMTSFDGIVDLFCSFVLSQKISTRSDGEKGLVHFQREEFTFLGFPRPLTLLMVRAIGW